MALDVSRLTEEDLVQLSALLKAKEGLDDQGRSPFRPRQLHNLNLPPTADDPRPTFFWSAEPPRNAALVPPPFAQLVWHAVTHQERTVHSKHELQEALASGWTDIYPQQAALSPEEQLERDLAQISPEDRDLLMKANEEARLKRIQAQLDGLSPETIARLMTNADATTPRKAKKTA